MDRSKPLVHVREIDLDVVREDSSDAHAGVEVVPPLDACKTWYDDGGRGVASEVGLRGLVLFGWLRIWWHSASLRSRGGPKLEQRSSEAEAAKTAPSLLSSDPKFVDSL